MAAKTTMADNAGAAAALLRVQNLVYLCKHLGLRVNYKPYTMQEVVAGADGVAAAFAVIVQVAHDSSFKKYLNSCSLSDLMLFRGLLLKVCFTPLTFGIALGLCRCWTEHHFHCCSECVPMTLRTM